MPIEIIIPRLGWSMEEGTFTGWLKKAGEKIKSGDALFSMESEKASQEIEATNSGILHIPADTPKQGDTVKVGQVIGQLLAEEDLPSERDGHNGSSTPAKAATEPKTETNSDKIPREPVLFTRQGPPVSARSSISPRARRRSEDLGVDVSRLQGSGHLGRIVEADVLEAKSGTAGPARISIMRRTIAQRTSASFSITPHFYLRCEADATALIRLREDLLPEVEADTGVRLTLTDFILRAQSLALEKFPSANAIWVKDDIIQLPAPDVGLVIGLSDGLMIPIVRSPAKENLAAVAKQRAALVESARAGTLAMETLQGGATSLSNLGVTRVDEFAAVIAPPQSTMLAIGRAALRPYVVNGKVAARTTMRLCLSVDHRVLDGSPAADFLGIILQLLESPDALV